MLQISDAQPLDEQTKAYLAVLYPCRWTNKMTVFYRSVYKVRAIITLPPEQPQQSGSEPRIVEKTWAFEIHLSCEVVMSL